MLQQTQVATVRAYFARFVRRFPDVQSLAAASQDDVLALWSGLGYYSRARNLHRCAQTVVNDHGGNFPRRSDQLAMLPGIGRSTAAAIATFCFGERVAILDGNVKRVLTRALGFDGDLSIAAQERALWTQAQALLPARCIEAYTQGLMDLGAEVCTLRRPRCDACPLAADCVAFGQGRPQDYPVKTKRLRRGQRQNDLLWLQQRSRVWLVRRPQQGVWAGLWSMPEWPADETLPDLVAGWPGSGHSLPAVKHALTHFDWTLRPLRWTLPARLAAARRGAIEAMLGASADDGDAAGAGAWFEIDAALRLGLPAPVRKLLAAGCGADCR